MKLGLQLNSIALQPCRGLWLSKMWFQYSNRFEVNPLLSSDHSMQLICSGLKQVKWVKSWKYRDPHYKLSLVIICLPRHWDGRTHQIQGFLVGGLGHDFYFCIYWKFLIPMDELIFFREKEYHQRGLIWTWPIYSWFTHWKWWFSIAMLNYQRVQEFDLN